MLKAVLRDLLGSVRRAGSGGLACSYGERTVLNVGGGSKATAIPGHYQGWKHVLLDIASEHGVDLVHDARELGLLPGGTFDAVYCSHNLEHYFPHEVPLVLAGFRHVLKPEGFVELRVPDLKQVIETMATRQLDLDDSLYLSRSGPISTHDVIYGWSKAIAGGKYHYSHKTGFSERSLYAALQKAGFTRIFPLASLGMFEIRVAAFRLAPHSDLRKTLPIDHSKLRNQC